MPFFAPLLLGLPLLLFGGYALLKAVTHQPPAEGPYAGCPMTDVGRGRYLLDCPNDEAFGWAVAEFRKKNPDFKVKGVVAESK